MSHVLVIAYRQQVRTRLFVHPETQLSHKRLAGFAPHEVVTLIQWSGDSGSLPT